MRKAQGGSLTYSPNLLPSTVLTWNLPISALNLITEEFITCKEFQKELGDSLIQLFEGPVSPAPKGGTKRAPLDSSGLTAHFLMADTSTWEPREV